MRFGSSVAPLHHLAVVRVRELLLRRSDEWTGVHGVQDLLGVQRQAGDVDGPKPVLDFPFSALAHIDEERRSKNLRLKVLVHGREIPRPSGLVDPSELLREVAPQGGDALLAVEHLVTTVGGLGEIDQAERIAVQDGPDHVYLPLASVLGVQVVALILRLDGQLAGKAVQAFSLVFIILEPLADIADGPVLDERCIHSYCFLRMMMRE